MLPFGLYMILLSTRGLGWGWLGAEGDCTYTLPLLLLAIGLYVAISRYYDHRFGVVQPERAQFRWLPGIVFLTIFFGAVLLEAAVKPPFSLIGVLVGALLIWSGVSTNRRSHLWVGAGIILLSLLAVIFPAGEGNPLATFGFWWNAVIGLAWVVLGIVDHFTLIRHLNALHGEPYA